MTKFSSHRERQNIEKVYGETKFLYQYLIFFLIRDFPYAIWRTRISSNFTRPVDQTVEKKFADMSILTSTYTVYMFYRII